MQQIKILFFGSTKDSVIILNSLSQLSAVNLSICCIVTQPAKPVGRDKTITATPTETWAKEHAIPVLSFPTHPKKPWNYADEQTVIDTLNALQYDLVISASYGQKIPAKTLADARLGGLNVHPSLLPRWRGGDPVPWAIMNGDHQVGVTVVSLSEKFDQGLIFAQTKLPVLATDTSSPLRTTLFEKGAQLLVDLLPEFIAGKHKGIAQHITADIPVAKRLNREIGFEPWEAIAAAITGSDADRIERKFRAIHPWPGIWTQLTNLQSNKLTKDTRLKILNLHLDGENLVIDQVQLEGKNPVSWKQFNSAYDYIH